MPKRIIVLGIMRSGTSLTAELIRRWGAYAGTEKDLWKTDADDPRGYGYMEYKPLQDLNDELLGNNDRVPTSDKKLEIKATNRQFIDKALELLHQMDKGATKNQLNSWVWKDARLPLTLPFWARFWEDPIFVITVRHPVEVVMSSAKIEGYEPEHVPLSAGFAYWQYCMLNILRFTQDNSHKIFIAYDQLVSDPARQCERLAHFLDEKCGVSMKGSKQRIDKMLPQVKKSQQHHNEKSFAETKRATKEQRALYNFLRVKTIYPDETFNGNDFALYPGWKVYLQTLNTLLTLSKAFVKN